MGLAKRQEIFDRIYQDTLTPLSRHVYFKIGDLAESEDLVATVYSDFFEHVVLRDKMPENCLAYLKKMADHEIGRYFARKPAPLSLDDETGNLAEIIPDDLDTEGLILESFAMDEIWTAVRQLSRAEQLVLIARHRLAMSFVEIARESGQGESTVRVRYHRAVHKLQKMLA